MKSKLLCLVLLVIAGSANAQKFAQNVSFGPIVGLSHSWISGMPGERELKLAPSAGVTLVYSAGAHWGFGFDAKFSREGGKTENPYPGVAEGTIHANYIRIPVKAMYFFGQLGDKARPKIMAGPTLGFLVGGKQKLENSQDDVISEVKTKTLFHGFDIGVQGGLGLNLRLTRNTWLNTDVSYYHGFRNVLESNLQEWKNRNIGVNVGVAFGIGTIKEE